MRSHRASSALIQRQACAPLHCLLSVWVLHLKSLSHNRKSWALYVESLLCCCYTWCRNLGPGKIVLVKKEPDCLENNFTFSPMIHWRYYRRNFQLFFKCKFLFLFFDTSFIVWTSDRNRSYMDSANYLFLSKNTGM